MSAPTPGNRSHDAEREINLRRQAGQWRDSPLGPAGRYIYHGVLHLFRPRRFSGGVHRPLAGLPSVACPRRPSFETSATAWFALIPYLLAPRRRSPDRPSRTPTSRCRRFRDYARPNLPRRAAARGPLDLKPTASTQKPDARGPSLPARSDWSSPGRGSPVPDCRSWRFRPASPESVAGPVTKEPGAPGARRTSASRSSPAQIIALAGPSGAGKTTLAQLVARLYDAGSGAVRMNGVDLPRDATLDSVRDAVGMVMQDAHLFHDTVRSNLLYARSGASEAELAAALRDAQVAAVVASLPQRPRHGESATGGTACSGGEKGSEWRSAPRLAAQGAGHGHPRRGHRAPRLGVRAGPAAIQGGVPPWSGACGAAHLRSSSPARPPLDSPERPDQILVLDKGRIVERGTHAELLPGGAPLRAALPDAVLRGQAAVLAPRPGARPRDFTYRG